MRELQGLGPDVDLVAGLGGRGAEQVAGLDSHGHNLVPGHALHVGLKGDFQARRGQILHGKSGRAQGGLVFLAGQIDFQAVRARGRGRHQGQLETGPAAGGKHFQPLAGRAAGGGEHLPAYREGGRGFHGAVAHQHAERHGLAGAVDAARRVAVSLVAFAQVGLAAGVKSLAPGQVPLQLEVGHVVVAARQKVRRGRAFAGGGTVLAGRGRRSLIRSLRGRRGLI